MAGHQEGGCAGEGFAQPVPEDQQIDVLTARSLQPPWHYSNVM